MKSFFILFKFELRRFASKRNILLLLVLLLFSLYFLQSGINEYKSILNRKDKFLEIEKAKVSQYINYSQYGTYGFRMLFMPSPLMAFFNQTAVIPDLTAYVDSGERLKIYLPFKGKNAFDLKNFGLTDFSGIMLFFGSLLALFYGFETFHSREYLKFLSSLASYRSVFFSLLFSRMIFVSISLLALTGIGILLVLVNGLFFPLNYCFLNFMFLIVLLALFFLLFGALLGTIGSFINSVIAMLSCWFILVFLIPTAVNIGVRGHADLMTPLYQLEMEKLKTVMDFEKRAIEKAGSFDYGKEVTEIEREGILSYWKNEFTMIHGLEENMISEMKSSISLYQDLSLFFPTTLYLSVNREISSRGYDNLVEFYAYVLQQKRDFFKFYMDKVYFSNFSKVESFIKENENVFNARSHIPRNFLPGLFLTLFYSFTLLVGTYHRFRNSLFSLGVKNLGKFNKVSLDFNKGNIRVWLTHGHQFKNLLYDVFSGEGKRLIRLGFQGKVLLDGEDVTTLKKRMEFFYLCSPASIPGDIKVKNFLFLVGGLVRSSGKQLKKMLSGPVIKNQVKKKFSQLDNRERGELLLALTPLKKEFTYLFHDIAAGMPVDFAIRFKEKMDDLKDQGSLVLYLTSDDAVRSKGLEKGQIFFETPTWCIVVDQYKTLEDR